MKTATTKKKRHPLRTGPWRYANDEKADQMVITFKNSGAVYGMVIEVNYEDEPVGLTRRLKRGPKDIEPLGPWKSAASLPEWAY